MGLGNTESERNDLPEGNPPQLVIHCKAVSPEVIYVQHTGSIIYNKQVICIYVRMDVTIKIEDVRHWREGENNVTTSPHMKTELKM